MVANYRALGLAEMATAIVEGRPHRCSGRFGLHALAVMLGIIDSAESGRAVKIGVPGTPFRVSLTKKRSAFWFKRSKTAALIISWSCSILKVGLAQIYR